MRCDTPDAKLPVGVSRPDADVNPARSAPWQSLRCGAATLEGRRGLQSTVPNLPHLDVTSTLLRTGALARRGRGLWAWYLGSLGPSLGGWCWLSSSRWHRSASRRRLPLWPRPCPVPASRISTGPQLLRLALDTEPVERLLDSLEATTVSTSSCHTKTSTRPSKDMLHSSGREMVVFDCKARLVG